VLAIAFAYDKCETSKLKMPSHFPRLNAVVMSDGVMTWQIHPTAPGPR
jgi:hypothetical protein